MVLRNIFRILMLVLIMNIIVFAQEQNEVQNTVRQYDRGILCAVEFRGVCTPPIISSSLGSIISSELNKHSIKPGLATVIPFKSQNFVEYTLFGTQDKTEFRTGTVYAEFGAGTELNIKSEDDTPVVLKIEINKVCWDIDLNRLIEDSKSKKYRYIFFSKVNIEDLTSDVNASNQLSNQKSFNINLEFQIYNISTGSIDFSFNEEVRQMDVSQEGAIRKGVRRLMEMLVKRL